MQGVRPLSSSLIDSFTLEDAQSAHFSHCILPRHTAGGFASASLTRPQHYQKSCVSSHSRSAAFILQKYRSMSSSPCYHKPLETSLLRGITPHDVHSIRPPLP